MMKLLPNLQCHTKNWKGNHLDNFQLALFEQWDLDIKYIEQNCIIHFFIMQRSNIKGADAKTPESLTNADFKEPYRTNIFF